MSEIYFSSSNLCIYLDFVGHSLFLIHILWWTPYGRRLYIWCLSLRTLVSFLVINTLKKSFIYFFMIQVRKSSIFGTKYFLYIFINLYIFIIFIKKILLINLYYQIGSIFFPVCKKKHKKTCTLIEQFDQNLLNIILHSKTPCIGLCFSHQKGKCLLYTCTVLTAT
jgi:hypothetical protein